MTQLELTVAAARPSTSARIAAAVRARCSPGPGWLLAGVLAVQLAFGLHLHNSISGDEALYAVSGQSLLAHWLHGQRLANFGSYFSGSISLYPVLSAVLERLGGLAAERAFSTLCLLGVTTLLYATARRLLGTAPALVAALLFATFSPTLFLSRLATFDAPSLLLLALALFLLVRSAQTGKAAALLAVGPLLGTAAATKYVCVEFAPVVLAVGVLAAFRWQPRRAAAAMALLTLASTVATAAAVWLSLTRTDLLGIVLTSSPARRVLHHATYAQIGGLALRYGGLLFALAVVGVAASPRRQRLLAAASVGATLVPVLTQGLIHESTSLYKHLAFGLLFSAPYAGQAVCALCRRGRAHALRTLAAAALVVGCVVAGQRSVQSTYDYGWPDTARTVAFLSGRLPPGPVLAENADIYEYYLGSGAPRTTWDSTYAFAYPSHGRVLTGDEALAAALRARFFRLVVLGSDVTPSGDAALQPVLRRDYRLIWREPYARGRRAFTVWLPRGPGGG